MTNQSACSGCDLKFIQSMHDKASIKHLSLFEKQMIVKCMLVETGKRLEVVKVMINAFAGVKVMMV